MRPIRMNTRLRTSTSLSAAALVGILTVAGCSGGGNDDGDGDTADAPAAADLDGRRGNTPKLNQTGALSDGLHDVFDTTTSGSLLGAQAETPREGRDDPSQEVAIISRATVELQSKDVARTRVDVKTIVAKYAGEIQADETSIGDDGEMETVLLVLRIPSDQFFAAKAEHEKVADLQASSSGSEDVTTKVIDNAARIRAQTASLERIEALLAEATNLREIIAIESQIARRQADLDSLKSRQEWLRDQTTLSTINVYIERTPEEEPKEDDDDSGFLAGLSTGWDGLVAATVGLATLVGLLLPFAAVLLLLGVPIALLLRRLRWGRPTEGLPEQP